MKTSVLRKGKNADDEKLMDMQAGPSSTMVTIPSYNFDNYSSDEDIDMVEQSPQITHTYSRKKSVEQLLQEWETEPQASGSNIIDNSIQIVRIEPLFGKENEISESSPDVVVMDAQSGKMVFDVIFLHSY